MALSIMTNTTALGAMNSVNTANSKLAQTIKQLSTGYRINSAADDASGLAVSEKLRGQMSGLAKAASNAQDAISMLQTAEGAMGSMTSIVQRMRELAVQAGDPAYTTNDRAMLQLEVDQLKEEINRVSTTTEFNTKKLLNGDAAALWSASSANVEAIIKGTPAEGNYKLSYSVDPGANAVYKSDVMALKGGVMSYDMSANATGITKVDNIKNMMPTGTARVTVMVMGSAAATARRVGVIGSTFGIPASTSGRVTAFSGGVTTAFTLEIQFTQDRTGATGSTVQFRARNAMTGEFSDWIDGQLKVSTANGTKSTIKALNSAQLTNVAGLGASPLFKNSIGITMSGISTMKTVVGDKILLSYNQSANASAKSTLIRIGSTGATVKFKESVVVSADYAKTTTLYTAQMDKAGNIYYGSMDLTFAKQKPGTAGITLSGKASLKILGEGDIVSKYTRLSDVARFQNADGRNVLDNTQELTIYGGNGKQATITLEGSDTIGDMEDKLRSAIVDQLGLGADVTNANATKVDRNLVQYIARSGDVTTNSDQAVRGTFVIQTAMLGKDSTLSFVGDQGVIDALSLAKIQEEKDSSMTVRVSDAHTGDFVGEDTITDGRLRNVIQGVDVDINPVSAADVTYNTTSKTMEFTAKNKPVVEYLHVVNNATRAAIGANEGQTLDLSIGRMDTKSLEIDDVNVVTFDNAQKSITKLDQALEKISKSRAVAGAQMNRLDYTITNLNLARENLTASESRIRDLDIAQASSDLAARQVLLQSATAMLAQANQLPSYAAQLLR